MTTLALNKDVISRIPGATATQYKEIALKMGEFGIVPGDFAKNKLAMYQLLQKDLSDFDVFLNSVKSVLSNPQKFNLTID